MMTLSELRAGLSDRNLKTVAARTGLHYNTLLEIRNNPEANPTNKTMAKLSAYFRGTL